MFSENAMTAQAVIILRCALLRMIFQLNPKDFLKWYHVMIELPFENFKFSWGHVVDEIDSIRAFKLDLIYLHILVRHFCFPFFEYSYNIIDLVFATIHMIPYTAFILQRTCEVVTFLRST